MLANITFVNEGMATSVGCTEHRWLALHKHRKCICSWEFNGCGLLQVPGPRKSTWIREGGAQVARLADSYWSANITFEGS